MKKFAIAKVCVSASMLMMVSNEMISVTNDGRDYIFTVAPEQLNDFKRIIMRCML